MNKEDKILKDKLKKGFLTEGVSGFDLIDAIKNHKVIYIYYAGDDTVLKGYRTVEPYLLGVSTAGNTVLRAWQQAGASDSNKGIGRVRRPDKDNVPGWRLFNIDFITTIHDTGKRFSTESGKIRPKYNPNDKQMSSITIAVQPGEEISDFGVGSNKSFDDSGEESIFNNQVKGFKGFSNINKRQELVRKSIIDLYEMVTKYKKKRAANYIIVNKNGKIGIDLAKNENKYQSDDVYGNLKDLYVEHTGNKNGSKKFFNDERRKFQQDKK